MPRMTPLKEARQEQGIQAKAVAEAVGITDQYYSEIENGRRPGFWLAKRISEFIGQPIGLLFPAYSVNTELNQPPGSSVEGEVGRE